MEFNLTFLHMRFPTNEFEVGSPIKVFESHNAKNYCFRTTTGSKIYLSVPSQHIFRPINTNIIVPTLKW